MSRAARMKAAFHLTRSEAFPSKIDRRVARTRRLLRDALMELIAERGFDKTTVRHILERSGIGRSTFYTHFADKEELLAGDWEWSEFIRRLKCDLPENGDSGLLPCTLEVFRHVGRYRDVYKAMSGSRAAEIVEAKLEIILADLTRAYLTQQSSGKALELPLDATIDYTVGALMGLLRWWMKQSRDISPEAMNALFRRLSRGL